MKILVRTLLSLFAAYLILTACQFISGRTLSGKYICNKLPDKTGNIQPNMILDFKKSGKFDIVEVSNYFSGPNDKKPESDYIIEWNKVLFKNKATLQDGLSGRFLMKGDELISDDKLKLRCKK